MVKEVKKETKKPAVKKAAKADVKATKPVKAEKVVREKQPRKWTKPFRSLGGYFKGAWQELKQVRWPNRKQTWALTLAVILFSFFLGLVIFLLDAGFTYLFKEVVL